MLGYTFERFTQQINYPIHALLTTSPRKILLLANFILAVCSACIAGFAAFLCWLLYDPLFTIGYINWLGLACVGLFLAATAIIGMRGAHLVSLELLLTYFWGIIIFSVPLMLGLFACFNFFVYTRIWFIHAWTLPNFAEVRKLFCHPVSTADNKCCAPITREEAIFITSTDNSNVTNWCILYFNATDCEDIRNSAILKAVDWGNTIIATQSIVGIAGLAIITFSVYTSYQILTSPVITQSMLDIINWLLMFPIAGCMCLAAYFWWYDTLDMQYTWLPKLWLSLGLAQVLALPLGIVSGRLKSRALLTTYILLIITIAAGLATAAALSWTLSKVVAVDFLATAEEIGDIACREGLSGCTKCDALTGIRCPEWNKFEVVTLMAINLRLAGMVSVFSILYLVGALVVASLVRNNLKNYKSESI